MTGFFETKVKNFEPKEYKKKYFKALNKQDNKSSKKMKMEDTNSSVVESEKEEEVSKETN